MEVCFRWCSFSGPFFRFHAVHVPCLQPAPPFAHLDDLSDMLWWPQRPAAQVPGWPVVFFNKNKHLQKEINYTVRSSRKIVKYVMPFFWYRFFLLGWNFGTFFYTQKEDPGIYNGLLQSPIPFTPLYPKQPGGVFISLLNINHNLIYIYTWQGLNPQFWKRLDSKWHFFLLLLHNTEPRGPRRPKTSFQVVWWKKNPPIFIIVGGFFTNPSGKMWSSNLDHLPYN